MEYGRKGRRLDLAQKSVGSSPTTPVKTSYETIAKSI